MDDEIIYYWCFNDVECFDLTPSAAIIILDKDLRAFRALDPSSNITMIYIIFCFSVTSLGGGDTSTSTPFQKTGFLITCNLYMQLYDY